MWLGDVSYGIFCLHLLALDLAMRGVGVDDFDGSFIPVFLLTVVATIAMAALSYYVIERPALRLKNRGPFVTRPAPARTTATTAKR